MMREGRVIWRTLPGPEFRAHASGGRLRVGCFGARIAREADPSALLRASCVRPLRER
jgi:hypothetical protein